MAWTTWLRIRRLDVFAKKINQFAKIIVHCRIAALPQDNSNFGHDSLAASRQFHFFHGRSTGTDLHMCLDQFPKFIVPRLRFGKGKFNGRRCFGIWISNTHFLHIPCFCYCSAARHSTAHVWGTCRIYVWTRVENYCISGTILLPFQQLRVVTKAS